MGASMSTRPLAVAPTQIFCMYMSGAAITPPGAPMTHTAMAPASPRATRSVPSSGSTAISHGMPPVPSTSPTYSSGASSFSPSPMITSPVMGMALNSLRMASTAAPSAAWRSPWPTQRADASAACSVTRRKSVAGTMVCPSRPSGTGAGTSLVVMRPSGLGGPRGPR